MRPMLLLLLLSAGPVTAEELFNKRVALVDDFPREVARGKDLVISGRRVGAYKTPELIVIAKHGGGACHVQTWECWRNVKCPTNAV